MELIVTSDNRPPPGASPSFIRSIDGLALRAVRWHPPSPKGTVMIASGRAELVEKYFETAGELLEKGFAVVAFDWRGQGLSARELKNPLKGHVDDFSLYLRDLDAVRDQVLEPFCPRPWYGLGHSMGGAILLSQAHEGRSPFERLVLTSPMIDLSGLRWRGLARASCEALDILGLGGAYVPGGRKRPYILVAGFERNVLTSDPIRFARCAGVLRSAPQAGVGDPTIGWANSAFRLMRQFADPEYSRSIRIPTLIIAAGDDQVVDVRASERFGRRLKSGDVLVLPYCRHEILLERDRFRLQFWSAFDSFVPGSEAELAAAAERAPLASRRARLASGS